MSRWWWWRTWPRTFVQGPDLQGQGPGQGLHFGP